MITYLSVAKKKINNCLINLSLLLPYRISDFTTMIDIDAISILQQLKRQAEEVPDESADVWFLLPNSSGISKRVKVDIQLSPFWISRVLGFDDKAFGESIYKTKKYRDKKQKFIDSILNLDSGQSTTIWNGEFVAINFSKKPSHSQPSFRSLKERNPDIQWPPSFMIYNRPPKAPSTPSTAPSTSHSNSSSQFSMKSPKINFVLSILTTIKKTLFTSEVVQQRTPPCHDTHFCQPIYSPLVLTNPTQEVRDLLEEEEEEETQKHQSPTVLFNDNLPSPQSLATNRTQEVIDLLEEEKEEEQSVLPSDLSSPESLDYCDKLVNELYNLYKREGKEMIITNNNKTKCKLVCVSQYKDMISFKKNSQKQNSWLRQILTFVSKDPRQDDGTTAMWFLSFFASTFKTQFSNAIEKEELFVKKRLTGDQAMAILIDTGVSMKQFTKFYNHLRFHWDNVIGFLPQKEIKEIGEMHAKVSFGSKEVEVEVQDDGDGETLGRKHQDFLCQAVGDESAQQIIKMTKEKKKKQKICMHYWEVDGVASIQMEAEKLIKAMMEDKPELAQSPHLNFQFGYKTKEKEKCCEISLGSDHGAGFERCCARMQMLSPQERKEANDPNKGAIFFDLYHIQCQKENRETMSLVSKNINDFIRKIEMNKLVGIMDVDSNIQSVFIPKDCAETKLMKIGESVNYFFARENDAGSGTIKLKEHMKVHNTLLYKVWDIIPAFDYFVTGELLFFFLFFKLQLPLSLT